MPPLAELVDVAEARRLLGVDRLILEIQDPSFPGDADEDVGRGTHCSFGARRFLAFVRALGFDGIQLGPAGQTSLGNPSPYDAALFPRDFLSAGLGPLARDPRWHGLLSAETLAALVAARPPASDRVHHTYAWQATARALDEAYAAFRRRRADLADLEAAFADFRAQSASWLAGDERDAFVQFVLHEQHRQLRADAAGMRLYGDLQIGMSPADAAALRPLFLTEYLMGAPPSRTNPEGQPWGYPVFDPRRRADVMRFLRARVDKLLAEHDGIRLDHPHGLVCPWVYRPGDEVAAGARLHESPDVAEHPALAPFAIARPEQIDRGVPRYADGWVRTLDDDQVALYAELVDAIMNEVRAAGGTTDDVVCEVLSTLPYPLARVLRRHGLGQFRVVQKLKLDDPTDVYRIERAQPEDWIMVGNHDTPPIWRLVDGWRRGPAWGRWGAYLAELLTPEGPDAERASFAAGLCADPSEMVHAVFAAVLASRARHVQVFFVDLFGLTDCYNVPGTVSDDNWTLRVPADYAGRLALDLRRACALAVRSRRR